jgi:hypothetical protein
MDKMKDSIAYLKNGEFRKAYNAQPIHPLTPIRKLSEYGENATRIGEFLKATNPGFIRAHMPGSLKAQPKSIFQAGYDSREVTTDFGRSGSMTKEFNQITAFANPQAQGVDRMVRAFKDNPASTFFKIAATTTVPGLGIYYYNRQDPRMTDVPRWEKDLFFHWPLNNWVEVSPDEAKKLPGNWLKQEGGKTYFNSGEILKMPKNFELGVLFSSIPERVLDNYFAKHPEEWKQFAQHMQPDDAYEGMGTSVAQALLPGIVPTALVPPFEQMTNFSMFKGRALISDRLKTPADRRFEYDNYTSETAKMLGAATANITLPSFMMDPKKSGFASPKIIENYVLGWSGTLGRYALQAADLAIQATGKGKQGQFYPAWKGKQAEKWEAPAWGLADYPVMRSFVSRMPATYSQEIEDFYSHYLESRTTGSAVKRLDLHGDKVGSALLREESTTVPLQAYAKAIGNLFKTIDMVQNAKNIPADDKKKLIDKYSFTIMKFAQQGNEAYFKIKGGKKQ